MPGAQVAAFPQSSLGAARMERDRAGGTLRGMPTQDRSAHDPLRVVIAGGGVAALETAVALGALAPGAVQTTVVSATDTYVDRPMTVGEPFGLGPAGSHSVAEICAGAGAVAVVDTAHEVVPATRTLRLASGASLEYGLLVLAVGAQRFPAFEHGTTFDRELSPEDFDDVLFDVDDGMAPRVAFVVPDGVIWSLPAYELALLTAAHTAARGQSCALTVFTHELAPLAVFGSTVSRELTALLDEARVTVRTGVHADVVTPTALRSGGAWVGVDRIVSLPRHAGPHLLGVPADVHGFIPADAHGRVLGAEGIYAAGDGTAQPIKQGGLAAQQADAVAYDIALRAGMGLPSASPDLVLRGLVRTAHGPRFMRAELCDIEGTSTFAAEPLWWPPSKIASRWLAPHLARLDADRRHGVVATVA
jgi:sulfide:quinone oxidoreductase